ncbi:ModD protein [Hydrogenobaculum acidophilum]
MIYITDEEIDKFIKDDVPYWDITTELLDIRSNATLTISNRENECILCGTEEAVRIAKKLDLDIKDFKPSGTVLKPNESFFEAYGYAKSVHKAWRLCLNILEYMSGIATKTYEMVRKAKSVNGNIEIATTRKTIGFNKSLTIKSIITGGAIPHRLGLSESILIFDQHKIFFKNHEELLRAVKNLKHRAKEHKVCIEVSSLEEATTFIDVADMIQFDKIDVKLLEKAVKHLKAIKPDLIVLAAGGINISNIEHYAATGADILVTSSLYQSPMMDFKAEIKPL